MLKGEVFLQGLLLIFIEGVIFVCRLSLLDVSFQLFGLVEKIITSHLVHLQVYVLHLREHHGLPSSLVPFERDTSGLFVDY